MVLIEGLTWDERAEEHIWRHGVAFEEVQQAVLEFRYARRSGPYLLVIGQTLQGRYLAIVLDDEGDGLWYPVTAREATTGERRLAARRGR
jgi:uncharacterized DUF497 family protein